MQRQTSRTKVGETEGSFHRARKRHECNVYFSAKCCGTGIIKIGEMYFIPDGDCRGDSTLTFCPYRVCAKCVAAQCEVCK